MLLGRLELGTRIITLHIFKMEQNDIIVVNYVGHENRPTVRN